MSERLNIIQEWLRHVLNGEDHTMTPLVGDASFRRYFRIHYRTGDMVLMDAPPPRETIEDFLHTTRRLLDAHVHVPAIYASSPKLGLILMEDLGDALFLNILRNDKSQAHYLYNLALKELVKIRNADCDNLPDFDEGMLMDEMRLFIDWYCDRHLGVTFARDDKRVLEAAFQRLAENALGQPQVYTHRDYHSRNLILTQRQTVGVLDHQDSVRGPLSYDLVSLLRDVYITWPRIMVTDLTRVFYQTWTEEAGTREVSVKQTETWFDLTALQRHLKVVGIFARLAYRDDKPLYLQHIPTIMRHLEENAARYSEFDAMRRLLARLPPDKKSREDGEITPA